MSLSGGTRHKLYDDGFPIPPISYADSGSKARGKPLRPVNLGWSEGCPVKSEQ